MSAKSPRYYRVTIILGNPDADLREWCFNNPARRTQAFRAAMREWLDKNEPGWAKDCVVNKARRRARPVSAAPSLSGAPEPAAEERLPASDVTPRPIAVNTPSAPAETEAPTPSPVAVAVGRQPEAPAIAPPDPQVVSDAGADAVELRKAKLRELMAMNEDFT